MHLYNKLIEFYNNSNYPFNLINNLKDNIIKTKNEIELEYSKDLYVDKTKQGGGVKSKKINIYVY